MNPDDLVSLLSAGATGDAGRSPDCPDEHAVAGYVDGGMDEAARRAIELHLADCSHCTALVALLCRERHSDVTEPVAAGVMAQARALVTKAPPRRWWPAPQWAAAAALILALPLLYELGRNADRGPEGQGRPEPTATRRFESAATELQVLSPAAGSVMDARHLSFHWAEVRGSPYYDVRIVTDAGDVVVQQRVTGTTWQPPAQLQFRPGEEYFVHVDAYPSGDKSLSSHHVPFRVAD